MKLMKQNGFMSKLAASWQKTKRRAIAAGFATAAMITTAIPASAATSINTNVTTESVVGGILDVIFKVALYLGIVICVIGVFMFIYAMKDDNAETQGRGARLAVIGAIMIGLRIIIQLTGLIK